MRSNNKLVFVVISTTSAYRGGPVIDVTTSWYSKADGFGFFVGVVVVGPFVPFFERKLQQFGRFSSISVVVWFIDVVTSALPLEFCRVVVVLIASIWANYLVQGSHCRSDVRVANSWRHQCTNMISLFVCRFYYHHGRQKCLTNIWRSARR